MITNKLLFEIKSKINDNQKQGITGGILQGVLVDMVESLSEAYPQTYTEEQKAQARANIDALSNYDGEITKEKLSLEVQAILNDVANKQNITDESLATIAKTIVGAINEVYKGGLKDASIATSKIEDGAITEQKLDTDLVNVITSAVQPAELASAIATALASYVAKVDILDTTGSATDKVMSQHGVTEEINGVTNKVTELESEVIYDVSAHNNDAVFESLSSLLGSGNLSTLIPMSVRKGGMSIRFIQSSDNKYVQYRLMATSFSTKPSNWQGVDDEPSANSDNLVKSGGIFPALNAVNKALLPINGKVSIIGDSISAFRGTLPSGYEEYYPKLALDVTSLYDMWWHIILSLTNSKLEVNASYRGSMVTSKEGSPNFYDRTGILGSPDYIFVALGTEDSQRGVALGDYDYDSENLSESEFIPAYIKGVKALKTNYPTARIILFTFSMDIPYLMAIKNIGKHYGIDVIDVSSYYVNNMYPNKQQMSIVAQTISTFYTSNASQLELMMTESLIGGAKEWSVLKPAGVGVTYRFTISPGTRVIISLLGVSNSDIINCTLYDGYGNNLGALLVANKKDTEINYLATNGLSAIRVTGNANSAVTLSIRNPITEEALNQKIEELSIQTEEELNSIKLGSHKIINTVTIPQRSSLGGTDYPLLNTLKKGIPYKMTKTCSDSSKYNNFRFKNDYTNKDVNFYIDGTYITGYATVSDGVHTLVLDDDVTAIRSTDNTGTSIEIEIAENLIGLYQTEKDIQEGLYPLLESKPLYDYTIKNQGLCIDDYISSIEAYRLIASHNGFNFLDQLDGNKIANIKYENTVHDSQIVVKGDIAYVVYAANTVIVDNAGSPTSKVILTKFNINDFVGTRVDLEVAKSGSNQQTGGAGQPNIVADETDADLLHIIYTCNNNGYTIFTCDYSMSNGTCSNYREVVVSNKAGETGNLRNGDINRLFGKNFTGSDSTYHSQQCNSTIAYSNGYYYIGMVIAESYLPDKNIAVIFKTQDFTNWNYFADYDSFSEPCLCELAIGADSNGNIYSASRPSNLYSQNMGQYGATYGVIAKWSSNGVLKERRYYRNCGTRASFFDYNGDLYLISNTWYRSICDIIRVNTEQLTASELYAQFKKPSFHYISCALYGDYVIVSSSSSNIEVSKITWPVSISENDAYTKIRELIM